MNKSLESILNKHLSGKSLAFAQNLLYGPKIVKELDLPRLSCDNCNTLELKGYTFCTEDENVDKINNNSELLTSPKIARICVLQNGIIKKTGSPIAVQKNALLDFGCKAISLASKCGVQIFCFQECWTFVDMPLAFCTQKKLPWVEFAEDAYEGPTTKKLCVLAKLYNMVIVSPILERDSKEDYLWNTAVVIDNYGKVLGISRKNHIPISGNFGESYYYNPSEIGHPVFQTDYGRIAVSICYERHFPQCGLAYGVNGAEIVFNPSATVQSFSESNWPIEARDSARQNGFYVAAINRVGTEDFPSAAVYVGPFYGSSYVAGPDGTRTPGLSLDKNGLLVVDVNLDTCSKKSPAERIGNSPIFSR